MSARYAAFRERHAQAKLPPLPTHAELRAKLKLLEAVLGQGLYSPVDGLTPLYGELVALFHAYRFTARCAKSFAADDPVGPPAALNALVNDYTASLPALIASQITGAYREISLPRAAWFELFDIADELLPELFTADAPPAAHSAPSRTRPTTEKPPQTPAAKRLRSESAEK
jgi:hypothetical protein